MGWRSYTAIALFAIAAPAYAGEELLFGERPQWVVDFDRVAQVQSDAELPVHVRLSDFQSRLEAGRATHYVALELEIRTPEGLSAGNLSLSWRPEFEDLTVHHVLIERGGTVTDVLAEGQSFTVLRREQNLEEAVLTGILTANLMPAGLEVGDVLRLAYTVSSANPVLGRHAETTLGPLNGIVGQSFVRLNWPSDIGLRVVASQDLPAFKRGTRGGYEFVTLEMEQREPLLPPAGAPPRYQLLRMVEATTFTSWGELSQLFVPLYEEASRIPADGPLRDALERIRAASDDPVKRTEAALALVQNQVRYVALAMGVGGLVPADTATTWARRFGDCKAKTALLLGLLRELGIEAEPVLVSSILGDALPQRLPMVSAFDHVLLRAHVNGQDYFLDGTRRGDTSLERIAMPHFVWGLPVTGSGDDLVPMVAPALAQPDEETVIRIDATDGVRAPSPTQVETVLRGDGALAFNMAMAQYVGQARRQVLEQYWRRQFDYITPENVDFRFDQNTNEARITLAGAALMDWGYNNFEPNGMRVGYTPDFTREPGPGSDAPFAVGHPFYSRTEFKVTLPEGFVLENISGENVEQTVAGVEYRRELGLADNVFSAVRSARSIAQEFPAAETVAAKQMLERLWGQRVFLKMPEGYRLSHADVAAMGKADSENPRLLADQGYALMNEGEYQAAKAVLDKVLEIDPRDEWALANRALAQTYLGNREGAESDAAKALEISPGSFVAYHALGELALRRQDFPAAVEAFSKAIDLEEGNTFALRQRCLAYSQLKDFDSALADADAIVAIEPDGIGGYLARGFVLAQARRTDDLVAHVNAMLARFPDEEDLSPIASQMFVNAGMDDEADALLSKSLAGGTSNIMALMTRASLRPTDETDQKLADLNEVLKLEPDFIPALLMRANTLWKEYRLQPALADANRVLELAPDVMEAYQTKIKILVDMNRRTEAVRTVDEMVEKFANDPAGLAMAAQSYQQLDRMAKAREAITRAKAIASENAVVRTIAPHIR
ncbi:MAG TPA: DUF3857 domain-containing protein [Croceibacterium sp.]|nr:DUF3857 domain-containing protein [Croceibacterium sp.]